MMRVRVKRILQIAVIAALTVFFLWLFLRNANLQQVGGHSANRRRIGWVLVGFAGQRHGAAAAHDPLADHPRSRRSAAVLRDVLRQHGRLHALDRSCRSAPSDVARPALLSRRTSHRFSGALGTVLTERVLDLTSILLLFVIFAFLRWNEFSHDRGDRGLVLHRARRRDRLGGDPARALAFLIIGLLLLSRDRPPRCTSGSGRILPQRVPRRRGCTSSTPSPRRCASRRHRRAFVKVVLLHRRRVGLPHVAVLVRDARRVHQPLPYDASFFVTGVTTVGLAIPTPGGIGGFHKACQLVLTRFYGFDVDSSVAVAVLFHVIGTLPVLVTGLFLFAKEGA